MAHGVVDREESTIQLSLPTNTRIEKKENLTSVIYRLFVCTDLCSYLFVQMFHGRKILKVMRDDLFVW